MTNNKLTDEHGAKFDFQALRNAAEKHRLAFASHRQNPRDGAALAAWDEASSEFAALIDNDELSIIDAMFAELAAKDAELQEYRNAEPVAYVDPHAFQNFSVYRAGETDNKRMGREWMWANPDAGLIPVYTSPQPLTTSERAELQEYRKAATPELKPANLINKFYERYPLAEFKTDSERSEALGYFMAGAELQCFGEFIKYEDLCGDE